MSEIKGRLPVKFSFTIERVDSKYVPWQISDDESEVLEPGNDYPLGDDISLFETETWPLPIESKAAMVGERFRIAGDVAIVFTKSWTDYGYEYDAKLEGDLSCTPLRRPRPTEGKERA